MMMRLATRSVYWSGMHKDITDFFNECFECNHNMRKNQKLPDLPEDETTRPYECISIDIFETFKKEHALAIIDRPRKQFWVMVETNLYLTVYWIRWNFNNACNASFYSGAFFCISKAWCVFHHIRTKYTIYSRTMNLLWIRYEIMILSLNLKMLEISHYWYTLCLV